MKVITTQFFFEAEPDQFASPFSFGGPEFQRRESTNVSVAWIRRPDDGRKDDTVVTFEGESSYQAFYDPEREDLETAAKAFLGLTLAGITSPLAITPAIRRPLFTRSVVQQAEAVWQNSVIVQRSPPADIPFKELVKGAGSASIGTFLGIHALPPEASPLLMFVSVPFGIMVVGTAIGLAKGFENGLQKFITAKFTQASKPPPRTPPTRAA